MPIAVCRLVEKIPLSAIQEGIDAFRNIVVLEQRRARQQAARVASRQGMRGALLALGAVMLTFAIHLAFFWVTVALYQRGWSIGLLIVAILGFGVTLAGLCYAIGKTVVRRASIKSIVRTSYERDREDRETAESRKEAA